MTVGGASSSTRVRKGSTPGRTGSIAMRASRSIAPNGPVRRSALVLCTAFWLLGASGALASAPDEASSPCEAACTEQQAACVRTCEEHPDPVECERTCEDALEDCLAQCE